jgi:hypothetical protein
MHIYIYIAMLNVELPSIKAEFSLDNVKCIIISIQS